MNKDSSIPLILGNHRFNLGGVAWLHVLYDLRPAVDLDTLPSKWMLNPYPEYSYTLQKDKDTSNHLVQSPVLQGHVSLSPLPEMPDALL